MDLRFTKDYVAEQLRAEIMNGSMPPGTLIRQEQVSAQLGVSRMPIREALQLLEQEGLVEKLPTRHIRVLGVSRQKMAQILAVSQAMELCVADLLAAMKGFEWRKADEDALAVHSRMIDSLGNQPVAVALKRLMQGYVRFAPLIQGGAEARERSGKRLSDGLAAKNWPEVRAAVTCFYSAFAP